MIQNQRWGGIEVRISHLEIKLDNNQDLRRGWVSTENLITTAVSLKSYLIFDVSVKRQLESTVVKSIQISKHQIINSSHTFS